LEDKANKKPKTNKENVPPGLLKASRWLIENPEEAALFLPSGVKKYLKTMGLITITLIVPVFLLMAMFTGPASFLPLSSQPESYIQEERDFKTKELNIMVKFQGVNFKGVAQQKINIKFKGLDEGLFYSFENIPVKQKADNPEIFQGQFSLPKEMLNKNYLVWLKGPVHLQRKFEDVSLREDQLLDLTAKPLLPGDLVLSQTGGDNEISELDRDYLWSLLQAAGQRQLTITEISSSDLDLDGKITGRDMSLLIDSGVGIKGEE
jgi:hypothetical protein